MSMVLAWRSCSQYSESDMVVLLSVECPVICQMQQLSVSMETTLSPLFSIFSFSLCGGKAVGRRRKWWCSEREGDKLALWLHVYVRGGKCEAKERAGIMKNV